MGRAAGRSELQVQNIPNLVLSGQYANPQSVKLARESFYKAGRGDAWNDLVAVFLKQKYDEAIKLMPVGSDKSGFSTNMMRTLFGNNVQKNILREALGGDKEVLQNMEWLMKVMDAQRITYGQNSKTAFFQRTQEDLARTGEGVVPKITRLLAVWQYPERLAEAWARYFFITA